MSKKNRKLKKVYKKEQNELNEDYYPNKEGMKKIIKGIEQRDKAKPIELIDRNIIKIAMKKFGLTEKDVKVGC